MKNLLANLTDVIFPPHCAACGIVLAHGAPSGFCPTCVSSLTLIKPPLCTHCGIPLADTGQADRLCGQCLLDVKSPLELIRSVGHYEGVLLEAIHRFKYQGKTALGEILGTLMANHDYPGLSISDYSLILPVPLHIRRLRKRGFNQSIILARAIARRFALPLDFSSLRRSRDTESQIHLGKKEREANVRGAFEIVRGEKIRNERIILVDDVYTTGSTLRECARALCGSKAAGVAALTLARAVS